MRKFGVRMKRAAMSIIVVFCSDRCDLRVLERCCLDDGTAYWTKLDAKRRFLKEVFLLELTLELNSF